MNTKSWFYKFYEKNKEPKIAKIHHRKKIKELSCKDEQLLENYDNKDNALG